MMMAALMLVLGHADEQAAVGVVPPIVAGFFLAITGGLLVGDLKQPKRFYYLLTKSNFDSWLVKGAYVLSAFAAFAAVWFLLGVANAGDALKIVAIPTALLGAATAGYTAFLFGQCEGRDLWQTPLLLPMLLARAVTAGAAAYAILDLVMDIPSHRAVWWTLLGGVAAITFLSWVELQSHGSRHVEMAIADMIKGAQKSFFRGGVALGMVLPAALTIIALAADLDNPILVAAAGLAALVGMFLSETAFVRAGQSVPLS
jgi:formate-dependent nitrite reductase membrane component NrfD